MRLPVKAAVRIRAMCSRFQSIRLDEDLRAIFPPQEEASAAPLISDAAALEEQLSVLECH